MDIIATALANAWLNAIRRAQSESLQRLAEQLPQSGASRAETDLTDVIQRAVETAGAAPLETASTEPESQALRLDIVV